MLRRIFHRAVLKELVTLSTGEHNKGSVSLVDQLIWTELGKRIDVEDDMMVDNLRKQINRLT